MSSLYVRNLTREWLATAAQAVASLPFVDTINRESNPQFDAWCSIDYLGGTNGPSTFCSLEEAGTFDVLFFSRGGRGDAELLARAEPVVAAFMANQDPTRALQLRYAGAPTDYPAGGGVPWWIVSFPVDYSFHH
jgi:hypothetical protein